MENLNDVLKHIALTQSPEYLQRIEASLRLIKAREDQNKLLKDLNKKLEQFNNEQ